MLNLEGRIETQGEAALASIYGGVSPVYSTGDWLALLAIPRSPLAPPSKAGLRSLFLASAEGSPLPPLGLAWGAGGFAPGEPSREGLGTLLGFPSQLS